VQNDVTTTVTFGLTPSGVSYQPATWTGRQIATSSIVQCPGGTPTGCAITNGAVTCSGTGGAAEPAADAVDSLPTPVWRH
jgi:hypothetical protein